MVALGTKSNFNITTQNVDDNDDNKDEDDDDAVRSPAAEASTTLY